MSEARSHRLPGRAARRGRRATAAAVTACALALGACAGSPPAAPAAAPGPYAQPTPAKPATASAAPAEAVLPEAAHDAAHDAAIRELIATTGSLERELARTGLLVAQLRADAPDLPEAVWTNLEARLRDREALLALYVPVYARHLAEDEVRALTAFYRSPLGARSLAAQERIRADSQRAAAGLATQAFGELAGGDPAPPAPPVPTAPTAPASSPASPSPTHAAAIRELIEVSNVVPAAQETMRRLLQSARANPLLRDTPPEAWQRAETRLTDPQALLAIWVPAYGANLAEDEVRALTAFYRSPLGARVASALPTIQAELARESQAYGTRAARAAIREVLGPLPTWRPR